MCDGFVTRREITARRREAGGSYEEIDATASGGGSLQPAKIYSREARILNANSGFSLTLTHWTAHSNASKLKVQFIHSRLFAVSSFHFLQYRREKKFNKVRVRVSNPLV